MTLNKKVLRSNTAQHMLNIIHQLRTAVDVKTFSTAKGLKLNKEIEQLFRENDKANHNVIVY